MDDSFLPMCSAAKLAKKLNNLASKTSSSLIRSFSNVAIVTTFLQQKKANWKNIWSKFPNIVAKIQFSGRLSQIFERGSVCALLLCVLFTFWHQLWATKSFTYVTRLISWTRGCHDFDLTNFFSLLLMEKVKLQAPFVHWKSVKMWKFVHKKLFYKRFEMNSYFQYTINFLLSRPWKKATTCHLSPLQLWWNVWSWNSAREVVVKKSKLIDCQVCDKVNFAPASILWKVRWVVAAFNGLRQTEAHRTSNQRWGCKVKANK